MGEFLHLEARIDGIYTLLQDLSVGQQKILSKLDTPTSASDLHLPRSRHASHSHNTIHPRLPSHEPHGFPHSGSFNPPILPPMISPVPLHSPHNRMGSICPSGSSGALHCIRTATTATATISTRRNSRRSSVESVASQASDFSRSPRGGGGKVRKARPATNAEKASIVVPELNPIPSFPRPSFAKPNLSSASLPRPNSGPLTTHASQIQEQSNDAPAVAVSPPPPAASPLPVFEPPVIEPMTPHGGNEAAQEAMRLSQTGQPPLAFPKDSPPLKPVAPHPPPTILYSDAHWREGLHAVLVVLACLEFISISSAFSHCSTSGGGFLYFLFIVSSLLLSVEIGLNFYTARPHHKWEINDDLKSCRKMYLKSWFGWDLLMAFPLDLLTLGSKPIASVLCLRSGPSAFGVLSLIRMLHVIRIPTYFRRRNPIMDIPRWVSAIFFLSVSTLVIHSFAIIWMMWASDVEQGTDEHPSDFAYRYASAFNWSFQTFVHGKSDVHAHYTSTMIYSMFVKIFGFLVVTTMEAKLAEFFVNHDPFHVWARQRRQQLASLISGNGVTWEIQKSIMAVYPTLLQSNLRQFYNVMEDLPPFLSAKINECMRMKLIGKVPMFAALGTDCQGALANVLVQELIPPETDIVRKGDAATSMFLLEHGIVDVIVQNSEGNEIVLTSLKDGSWFGEIALLQETTRTATVRTSTVASVYRLDKADFNEIAQEYPELRSHLEGIASQRISSMRKRRSIINFTSIPGLRTSASLAASPRHSQRSVSPSPPLPMGVSPENNPLASPLARQGSPSFQDPNTIAASGSPLTKGLSIRFETSPLMSDSENPMLATSRMVGGNTTDQD